MIIRIPMQLERRGGRKLIITPDGAIAAPRKSARDEALINARAPMAAADRERESEIDHRSRGTGGRH